MHRYVGVLFALLAVYNLRVLAAGNIGCLFSDRLCEQEREWCFDDHAFGHCLSHYGHLREDDFHRYELESDELRLLEQEMQRLFLLGYRWSHTYTQCVLQELLHAIRRKAEFDISSCNGDVDQDLEGALRAIEGEELEQVDPRDLAIVRFTPSATDPHSDYADEVYFPPIKDQLLDDHSEDNDDQDEDDHPESPTSEPGGSGREDGSSSGPVPNGSSSPHHQPGGGLDSLPANPPGPPSNSDSVQAPPPHDRPPTHDPRQQNYINYYGGPDDDDDDDDDYDDSSNTYRSPYHYQTPLNPVYRKRSRMDENVPFLRGDKLTISPYRTIAKSLLDSFREQDPLLAEAMLKDDEEEELDEGVFGESPTRPMYTESGMQFTPDGQENDLLEPPTREAMWYNVPQLSQDLRMVPGGPPNIPDEGFPNEILEAFSGRARNYPGYFRNMPGGSGGLRNLNLPGPYAQYMPQEEYRQEPLLSENSINRLLRQQDPPPYEFGGGEIMPLESLMLEEEIQNSLPRSGNRVSALQEAFGPQLNSIRDPEEDYMDYYDYGRGRHDDYGDYGQYDDAQLSPDRAFPFLQKFDKKDEESAGGDYDILGPRADLSFQRPERDDTKKPGPGFTVNAYSFKDYSNNEPTVEDFDISEQEPSVGERLLLPRLLSPNLEPLSENLDRMSAEDADEDVFGIIPPLDRMQMPDLLLDEERVVDEAPIEVEQGPKAEKLQDTKKEEVLPSSEVPPTEPPTKRPEGPYFIFITIDGNFTTEAEGMELAEVMARKAGPNVQVHHVKIHEDRVIFEIKDFDTAATVVKNAETLEGVKEPQTGLTIKKAGFETKTKVSSLVYTDSERHMLAAAAIVCGSMTALLVAASVLFFLRKQAKSKAKIQGLTAHDTEASKDYQDLCRARMAGKAGDGSGGKVEAPTTTHVPSQRVSSLSKDSDNGNNSPSSRSSTSSWSEEPVASNMDISTGHMVLTYMEDHLKNKDRLEQEWIALCAYEAEPCATTLAMKPENSKKNRYPDSVPYDHNRVLLNSHANVNGSDYINASSITDHDPRNPAYIATQGPLSTTAADFWQLVWEQGSVVIVMLTRLTENGHAFCHRYWPEEGSDLYHIYEVHLVSEHIWCDDYLVRSFYLKNVKTGETRTVTQFHFLSWPDSGTPASTKALLEFRRKVNKSYRGRSCPIIVHCSDGIGRTGTYCLIDMVLNRMAKGAKEIDIAATLEHIRDQRPHMVKSKAQFEFVLMAVAEEVHAILKALPQ